TKSLLEGVVASAAFVNQGSDMVAGQGMQQALLAAQNGTHTFGGVSAGRSRYPTGSHVDVKNVSVLLGLSNSIGNAAGNLTLGGFVELGQGGYDSFNSFANRPDVRADGDLRYHGAGVLARQDFKAGAFVEGSLRLGKARQEYSSSDLTSGGKPTHYRRSSNYYGAHLGAGWSFGPFTLSGQYLWTHQKGGTVHLPSEPYQFDAMNSQRLRIGGQYQHAINDSATFQAGAAWEYEFDGKAAGRIFGRELASPSLKGHTGIFNLGLRLKPGQSKRLTVDLGAQGYVGMRRGVSGHVQLKYAF
ncbi:MAG: autotransporter outer membrane beta-barrel domain-containing protein, partial [Brachymonas sp.]|nr:autotransporter outer membrane beta-barrel domain-containing protein [Brachymonas sp.]